MRTGRKNTLHTQPRHIRNAWIGTTLLVVLDQSVKLLVKRFVGTSSVIVSPILYFQPVYNREYSWLNSMFGLGIGFWAHVALVCAMLVFILMAFGYSMRRVSSRYVEAMFAILIAGALCSLLDKTLWGGSLDYILVTGLFTFDLKDVYINAFIAMLFAGWLWKNQAVRTLIDPKPKQEQSEAQ